MKTILITEQNQRQQQRTGDNGRSACRIRDQSDFVADIFDSHARHTALVPISNATAKPKCKQSEKAEQCSRRQKACTYKRSKIKKKKIEATNNALVVARQPLQTKWIRLAPREAP